MSNLINFPSPPSTGGAGNFGGLTPGGGGGDDGGMERRISRLESNTDRMDADLSDIKVTLARIEAKLDAKIDYKWLTVYVLGIIAVILRSEIASLFSSL